MKCIAYKRINLIKIHGACVLLGQRINETASMFKTKLLLRRSPRQVHVSGVPLYIGRRYKIEYSSSPFRSSTFQCLFMRVKMNTRSFLLYNLHTDDSFSYFFSFSCMFWHSLFSFGPYLICQTLQPTHNVVRMRRKRKHFSPFPSIKMN